MSQHDYDIANQTASATRSDLNLSLKALASQSSGATAPSTTYANMPWYDTSNNLLKMRNEADDAWITIGTLDQSGNTFTPEGLSLKADIASPVFTGNPKAPTQTTSNNSTRVATTAFTRSAITTYSPTPDYHAGNAALGVGSVGTYAFLAVDTSNDEVTRLQGSTLAGSALLYANANRASSVSPAGTWRLMGNINLASTSVSVNTSVWLRIS